MIIPTIIPILVFPIYFLDILHIFPVQWGAGWSRLDGADPTWPMVPGDRVFPGREIKACKILKQTVPGTIYIRIYITIMVCAVYNYTMVI